MLARNAVPGARPASDPDEAPPGHERGETALQRATRIVDFEGVADGVDRSAIRKPGDGVYDCVEFRLQNLLWHLRLSHLFGAIAVIVPQNVLIWRNYFYCAT